MILQDVVRFGASKPNQLDAPFPLEYFQCGFRRQHKERSVHNQSQSVKTKDNSWLWRSNWNNQNVMRNADRRHRRNGNRLVNAMCKRHRSRCIVPCNCAWPRRLLCKTLSGIRVLTLPKLINSFMTSSTVRGKRWQPLGPNTQPSVSRFKRRRRQRRICELPSEPKTLHLAAPYSNWHAELLDQMSSFVGNFIN